MTEADVRDAPAAPPRRSRRTGRARLFVPIGVAVVALGWVAFSGLRGNLVYYQTPTEVLHQGSAAYGQRIRLGGLVEPGSVQPKGDTIRFLVTDGTTTMTVVTTAGVPKLFRGGAGVVAEGSYGPDGTFHADDILVKHDDTYSPPAPGQTPTSANLAGG